MYHESVLLLFVVSAKIITGTICARFLQELLIILLFIYLFIYLFIFCSILRFVMSNLGLFIKIIRSNLFLFYCIYHFTDLHCIFILF